MVALVAASSLTRRLPTASLRRVAPLARLLHTPPSSSSSLLVINAGSSTLKYKLFEMDARKGVGAPLFAGLVELSNASSPDGRLVHQDLVGGDTKKQEVRVPLPTHRVALEQAVARFFGDKLDGIQAIGHRVVHGGEKFHDASTLTPPVIDALTENIALAPLHNPANLLGIDVATEVFGKTIPQVGVFDTAFHATMPPKAFTYAVPFELYEKHGVRRYGFHGTSHQFVAQKAAEQLGKPLDACNLITCHLGNGSSMAALRGGKCIDTTMGLTPLEGLVMGTRSGDVDPALHNFLASQLKMTMPEIDKLLNKQSGLQGICGDSDIRKIQDRVRAPGGDARADLALDVYSHRVRKYLGAYLLELGGAVDAVVFTAGIGENSAMVRERVCRDLSALGIELDADNNARSMLGSGPVEIQSPASRTKVLVIPTDEELSIAEQTFKVAFQQ